MHQILEKVLVKKYPKIFRDYGGDITKTCMGWGMSCGKGWFLLIDELCSKLSETAVALQVKEKFGGLRFYLQGTEEDYEVESEYESKSYETCEECGEAGEREDKGGWLKTICPNCRKNRDLSAKIRSGDYAYRFCEGYFMDVYDPLDDPEAKDPVFHGTFHQFMKLVSPDLRLLEVPIALTDEPLWEQIKD